MSDSGRLLCPCPACVVASAIVLLETNRPMMALAVLSIYRSVLWQGNFTATARYAEQHWAEVC